MLLGLSMFCQTTGQNPDEEWRKLDSIAMELPGYLADSSLKYALKALTLAKQTKNDRQLAITYLHLGMLSNELNDFNVAIRYLNQGLFHANNDTTKAAAYTELGRAYDDSSRPDSAIYFILKGLEIHEKFGPEYEAKSLRKLAFSYRSIYEYEKSLGHFKLGLEKEKQAGLDSYIKRSYMNIGLLFQDLKQFDSAIHYYNKSYELIASDDLRGNAVYNNNMATVYIKLGKINKAIPYAEKNLKWKIKLGDQQSLTLAYNILSDIYLQLGDYQKAKDYGLAALQVIDTFPVSRTKLNAHRHLLDAKIMLRDTMDALKLLNSTLAIKNELFEKEKAEAFAEMTVQYDSKKKEYENQLLRTAALADGNTINNQYAIILAGSIVLVLMIALILIVVDRSKQNRIAHIKMTEQKEEIEAQRNQLEEINRTKDRFFGIISHDLRGPVNAFQGLSALTRMYLEQGDKDQIPELIDRMDQSSNRLATLLDNLLNWALAQQGSFPYSPESFKLDSPLNEVLGIFVSSAKAKGITIEDRTDHNTYLYADVNGFKTILRNLLNNAIKYSKKEDSITITGALAGDKYYLRIKDTGAGMNEDQLIHLFDLEKNASMPGTAGEKGSGLGLVLCKELIDLNNGEITVESELNKGTIFTVWFPKG